MADQFETFVHALTVPNADTPNVLSMLSARIFRNAAAEANSLDPNVLGPREGAIPFAAELPEGAIFWRPELAQAIALRKQAAHESFIVQMAICAFAAGGIGTWKRDLSEPAKCYFEGEFFGAEKFIEIEADSNSVLIKTLYQEFHFCRRTFRLTKSGTRPALMAVVRVGHKPLYVCALDATGHPKEQIPWASPEKLLPLETIGEEVEVLEQAITGIQSISAAHSAWIGNAIGMFVIPRFPNEPRDFFSSGSRESPASITISFGDCARQPRPWWISAADIVHEASHQYYELLHRYFPTATQKDGKLYYSAFARRGRPPDRTLLGLHAAANMKVFLHEVSAAFPREVETCPFVASVVESAQSLTNSLKECGEFNRSGELMYRTLSAHVDTSTAWHEIASTHGRAI